VKTYMRKIKLKQGVSLIHLALIAALLFSVTPKIVASDGTTLSIVPQNNVFSTQTTPVNSAFFVNATVTNVTDLWHWQVNVTFDPSMLACLNASIPSSSPFNFPNQTTPVIDNVAGYVMLGASQISPSPGVNGSGVLATIAFQIISAPAQGLTLACDIAFSTPYGADTFLLDSSSTLITATVVNGHYQYTWPPPTLSIVPQNNVYSTKTTAVNSTFVVNATVTNVTDLFTWQIRVTFDPSMLNCSSVSAPPSPFSGFTFPAAPIINNIVGYVMWGATLMGPVPGIDGTGVLAAITFQIVSAPTTPNGTLACDIAFSTPYGADTFLLDSSLSVIPATVVNGHYQYTWPPPPLPYLEVRPSIYKATQLGEDVAIQIWVHNVSEEWSIVCFQVILRFNASLLEPSSVSNGTFLEAFVTSGESMLYLSSATYAPLRYIGNPALPPGYNAWVIGAMIMPDGNGTWHAPFPSGEGLLATLHFNATLETVYPQIAWTDLSFTHLVGNPSNPYENLNCLALDVNMNEIPFIQLINGTYRAPYTCNLTITTTTGGTTSPAPGIYTYSAGTNVTVTANPTGFYVLDHWVLDGVNKTGNPITVTMDTDHALQAVFLLPNYTLTITSTGGGTTNPATGSYSYVAGTNVTVTASPSAGYNFGRWVLDGANYTVNPITVTMGADHTLRAVFTCNLTITTTTAGGTTSPAPGSYTYDVGTNVTVTASPSAGYNFSSWLLDGVSYTVNPITVTMNANHTLNAAFEDVTPPTIGAVTQSPLANNVLENAAVLVSVNVTDAGSDVKNVTLIYTTDNWTTYQSLNMTLSTGLWEATIPGKALGTLVKYKIVAYDKAGNSAVDDKAGNYYVYTVIPEFSALGTLLILLGATLSALVLTRKSRKPKAHN
jgi:hypothetical protein